MRPTLQRDLIDSRDIQVLSLHTKDGNTLLLLNVYSDDESGAIKLLDRLVDSLPLMTFMGGDFNCRSRIWDVLVPHDSYYANLLVEVTSCLGLSLTSTPGMPTHFPFNKALNSSTIDLMFSLDNFPSPIVSVMPEEHHSSDHTPMMVDLPLMSPKVAIHCKTLPKDSDKEASFLYDVCEGFKDLKDLPSFNISELDSLTSSLHARIVSAFKDNAKLSNITCHSKPWWNKDCSESLALYRTHRTKENWFAFRNTTRCIKRAFFNEKIEEIATLNRQPWDLMSWVKARKLPAVDTIHHEDSPCEMPAQLWNGLQSTYNSAADRPVPAVIDNYIPSSPPQEWTPFTLNELCDSLEACSNTSAPGPDHLTWRHLKVLLLDDDCARTLLLIGNSCISLGHWLSCFKESVSVIIPKLGKPHHNTPKMFHPIVLLNTISKLFKKILAQRMQYDAVQLGIFHSNQLSGIKQRSTEDAGIFLTHLICAG
jgi:hypothetical protein